MMKRPRILLADDHALLLDGIRNLLEHDYIVAGVAQDGRALVDAAIRLKPDLIILDITMPRFYAESCMLRQGWAAMACDGLTTRRARPESERDRRYGANLRKDRGLSPQ